jgi:hypothetical protein
LWDPRIFWWLKRKGWAGNSPQSEPAWPADPRRQLRAVTSGLDAASLRTVAQFGAFLAMNQAEPPRRRIGFVPPTSEGSR